MENGLIRPIPIGMLHQIEILTGKSIFTKQ